MAPGDFRVLDYCNLSKNHIALPVRKKKGKNEKERKTRNYFVAKNVMGGHFRQKIRSARGLLVLKGNTKIRDLIKSRWQYNCLNLGFLVP